MSKLNPKEIRKTTIGGQALIEGILMRGPHKSAIVVRKPEGDLETKVDETGSVSPGIWGKIPIVRGVIGFVKSMAYGFKALNYSADFFPEEEGDPNRKKGRFETWMDEKLNNPKAEKAAMTIAMVIGVLLPIVLFMLTPTLIAGLFGDGLSSIVRNLVEGGIRIVIFLLFLLITSRQKDVRRTYMYHGAEHKTIACYESGAPLTVENVRQHSRFHPRCGTSFLFVVMIISILFHSLFTWGSVWVRMAVRLAGLPVIVGLSFEINRFAGRHDNFLTYILRAPGLFLQRLTTFEPDDSMIEVGIAAMEQVIPQDSADKW